MTINFCEDIGEKISCGAYTKYRIEDLLSKQVICMINLYFMKMGSRKIGCIGTCCNGNRWCGTTILTTLNKADNGQRKF